MNNDYVIKKVYQSFLLVSILSFAAGTLGVFIDNIVAGQFLGTDALGAMGIVGPVSILLSAFGNISSSGGTAQAAQALGKRDQKRFNHIFSLCIVYTVLIGLLIALALLLFTPFLADLLGARGSLYEPSLEYMRGFAIGTIPTITLTTLCGFIKIDGSTNLPLISIVVMSIADVALDLLMVPVLHLGMFGLALATSLSYFLAIFVALAHFFTKHNTIRFSLPKKPVAAFKSVFISGLPTAGNRICNTLRITLFNNLLVGIAGAGAVAALNIRMQVYNLFGAVTSGVGQAIIPTAGIFYGEEDGKALQNIIRTALKLGSFLAIPLIIILLVFAGQIPAILGVHELPVVDMAALAIRIYAICLPIEMVNFIWVNFYQTTGNDKVAIVLTFLEILIYPVAFAFLLSGAMGTTGVWLSFLIGEILTFITLYLYVAYKTKKIPSKIFDFLLLGKDFGKSALKRYDLSIGNDIHETVELSRKITKIGAERGIDPSLTNKIALTIEEMAGNIIQHSFKPGEKKWLDVLILVKPETVTVRLRDNGKYFNPVEYLNQQEQTGNGTDLYGIRVVSNLSDDFYYNRAIGLNNVIVSFDRNDTLS